MVLREQDTDLLSDSFEGRGLFGWNVADKINKACKHWREKVLSVSWWATLPW
jgi:hypothetical protein